MGKYFLQYPRANIPLARTLRKNMTRAERRLWKYLRNNGLGVRFRRQVPFGPYIVDFMAITEKIVVELDGSQHYTPDGKKRDADRDAHLRRNGLRVLRFSNIDCMRNVAEVLERINECIYSHEPEVQGRPTTKNHFPEDQPR